MTENDAVATPVPPPPHRVFHRNISLVKIIKKDIEETQNEPEVKDYLKEYSMFSSKLAKKLLRHKMQNEVTCKTVFGAVLFADISGFTRLSARLSAEEVKYHINEYFNLMGSVIDEYYGDVIKFCGDALIVMWPVDFDACEDVKNACVYIAATCALELLNVCGQYDRGEGESQVSLRLHCGIGSGSVHCMCLGEGDTWEFLISGEPLQQAGRAESEAKIGEVCVSQMSYTYIEDRMYGIQQEGGSFLLCDKSKWDEDNGPNSLESQSSKIMTSLSRKFSFSNSQQLQVQQHTPSKLTLKSVVNVLLGLKRRRGASITSSPSSDLPSISISTKGLSIIPPPLSARKTLQVDSNMQVVFDYLVEKPTFAVVPKLVKRKSSTLRRMVSRAASVLKLSEEENNIEKLPSLSELLKVYVPDAARSAIETDTLDYLAELRLVTTMFIELGLREDFALGNVLRPQKVFCLVLTCLLRYSGSLRQYVVDDKGCVIIAAFGLPGSTHEDNSYRAVVTALSVMRSLMPIKVNCRIGIAMGRVFCGLVGSATRCEYAMVGSSVNLAARLMSNAAMNSIVVSEEVYNENSDAFEFTILPKIVAKGYSDPVAAFSPKERIVRKLTIFQDTSSSSACPFVGREKELLKFDRGIVSYVDAMNSNSQSCCDEAKQFHLIKGAPGSGKTWLVGEVHKRLLRNKILKTPLISTAASSHSTTKFFVMRQLFDQIFQVDPSSDSFSQDVIVEETENDIFDSKDPLDRDPGEMKKSMYSKSFVNQYTSSIAEFVKKNATNEFVEVDETPSSTRHASPGFFREFSDSKATGKRSFHVFDLLPLLNEVLPVNFSNDGIRSICFQNRMKTCEQVIIRILIVALSKLHHPMIIENLHWCDENSLSVLASLIKDTTSGLCLFTIRQLREHAPVTSIASVAKIVNNDDNFYVDREAQSSNQRQLIKFIASECSQTFIRPFNVTEVKEMIEKTIPSAFLMNHASLLESTSLVEIVTRTGGSPFLTSALIFSLKEALLSGKYIGLSGLPSGENNIIFGCFDQLKRIDQMILKAASVVGNEFSADFLERVVVAMGTFPTIPDLGYTLMKLTKTNLVRPFIESKNGSYTVKYFAFTDHSVSQCIYNLMLIGQRQIAHNTIALLMETDLLQHSNDITTVDFQEITRHFLLANNVQKCYEYLEKGFRVARRHHRFSLESNYLNKLILISTGIDASSLLNHCQCTSKTGGEVTNNRSTASWTSRGYAKVLPLIEEAKWLKWEDLVQEFDVLTTSENAFHEFAVAHNFPHHPGAMLKDYVCCWLGCLSDAQFRLGYLNISHNLALLSVKAAGLPCLASSGIFCHATIDNTLFHRIPSKQWDIFAPDILTAQLHLMKILLIRGRVKQAYSVYIQSKPIVHFLTEGDPILLRYYSVACSVLQSCGKSKESMKCLNFARHLRRLCLNDKLANGLFFSNLALIHSTRAEFKSARVALVQSFNLFKTIDQSILQNFTLLKLCWSCLLSGRYVLSNEIIAELQANEKSFSSCFLKKSFLLLKGFYYLLGGLHQESLETLEIIRQVQKRESDCPTTCALIGMNMVFCGREHEGFSSIKFACVKLGEVTFVTPMSGIAPFCAGYAALKVIASLSHEISSYQVKRDIDDLRKAVRKIMECLKINSRGTPSVMVLHDTLLLMYNRQFNVKMSLSELTEIISTSCQYYEFIFATAFLYQQLGLYYQQIIIPKMRNLRENPPSVCCGCRKREDIFLELRKAESKSIYLFRKLIELHNEGVKAQF